MRFALPLWLIAGCTPAPEAVELPDTEPGPTSPPVDERCGGHPCVPAPDDDGVEVGWYSLATDPDGAVWISWAEVYGPSVIGTFVARSPEPGVLEAPIAVPTIEAPIVGGGERPQLAVSDDRVALGYTGIGTLRHGDAHAMYVQLGTRDGGEVVFDDAVQVDDSSGLFFVLEHARVAFAPDGELWALWKRQEYGISDVVMWAREDAGFAPEPVSDELSELHDCSPPDFRFAADGSALLMLRQNLDWVIETVFVAAEPGRAAFGSPVQVSDNDWQWADECPEDGPRIAAAPDGALASVWIAPSAEGYRTFRSTSTDAGLTWSPHAPDHDTFDLGEDWPTVAVTADGAVLSTSQDLWGVTRLFRRDSLDGPVVEERVLTTPDGLDLEELETITAGERTVGLALGDDGALWLLEL